MRPRLSTRTLLSALILMVALAAPVSRADEISTKSTTFSADLTGIWWVPTESGWGVNIIQQSQILFVTFFIYGQNGQPTWVVGPDIASQGVNSSGNLVFSGALYQTTGPWFGNGFFDPTAVGVTQVGSVTFSFSGYGNGQVTYSVNGVQVTKNIVPQNWLTNNLSGTYLGAVYGLSASCSLPIATSSALLAFTVTQSGSNAAITIAEANGNNCIFTGTTTAVGKLVNIDGNYVCTNSSFGTFAMRRVEGGIDGLTGLIANLSSGGCSASVVTIGAARVQ
jgi:hypothetical protein